jgi:hypothetical protein
MRISCIGRAIARVACTLGLMAGSPSTSDGQTLPTASVNPEVFGSIGFGHLANSRRTFGDTVNVGGSVGIRWRRLITEFEVNRMLGLSPQSLSCAVQYGQTCLPGRQGALAATTAAGNVLFLFPRRTVEPYVTGGLGVMVSTHAEPELDMQFSPVPNTPPIAVNLIERKQHDVGFAFNFGAGLRIPVTSTFMIRPELRLYDATLLSAYNMGLLRASMQVGYRW